MIIANQYSGPGIRQYCTVFSSEKNSVTKKYVTIEEIQYAHFYSIILYSYRGNVVLQFTKTDIFDHSPLFDETLRHIEHCKSVISQVREIRQNFPNIAAEEYVFEDAKKLMFFTC